MRALTLTQPWAQLMADERKHYETRSWFPHGLRRGELLAIHAAKGWTPPDRILAYRWGYSVAMPRACVVAVVRFVAAVRTEALAPLLSDEELSYGDYSPGRWAWQTELVRKLPVPVPCKGALGLWKLPDGVAAEIRRGVG